MQSLITLDFGNTHPHAGLFQKVAGTWQIVKVVPVAELSLFLNQLEMTAHNTSIVLSDVKPREDVLQPLMEQGFLLTRVKEYWRGDRFAGMPVNYAKTLGEDRLIEAFYVYKKLKTSALIIDAGTFVTMDVVTKDGFKGGYILPGIESYFQTFQKGEQLKDVSLETSLTTELPHKTADAMSASYTAFASLARELVSRHELNQVILTGGKAELWKSFLNLTNAEVNPHLIHWALLHWFTTQIEPL